MEVEEYVQSFKPFLMDVIYNWSKVSILLAQPLIEQCDAKC